MIRLDAPRKRLHSGAPWWLMRDGLGSAEASLPVDGDVAIVGAGITGALAADVLSAAGLRVVIVDRRLPVSGSTAVSTALLQYEIDTELVALSESIGDAAAARAYQLSSDAVRRVEELSASLGDDCGFEWRTSLYLASTASDALRLRDEADARTQIGLDATFLDADQVRDRHGLPSFGALASAHAGVVDPVRLARALLERAESRGATIVPWTTALNVSKEGSRLSLVTDRGAIMVNDVVLACGYEVPPCIEPSVTALHSTYALITEPVPATGALARDVIVWESRRPYTYMRAVEDRWVIGGMDIADEGDAHRDAQLPERVRALERELQRLQPGVECVTAFSWAGTFGETRDGLPVVGPVSGIERVHYALGYGGNGITFSVIAADLLRDRCLGRDNPDLRLFRPDR